MDEPEIRELKCVDDINTFFNLNDLDEISDEEELNEYMSDLSIIGKCYRDVHTELSVGLGDADYAAQYPKHKEFLEKVNGGIQNAKRKLRKAKRGNTKSKVTEKENELLSEKKYLLQRSEDFFEKIKSNVSSDLDDLRHDMIFLESHLADSQKLRFKVENVFKDFEPQSKEILEMEKKIKENIALLQERFSNSKKDFDKQRQNSIDEENKKLKESNDNALKEQEAVVEHIFKEIEIRCDSFESKVDKDSIKSLTGHQLLEAEKRLFDLDRDFGEILDKITVFVEKFSGFTDKTSNVTSRRDAISKLKVVYFDSLKSEITARDLSEEKLKSALTLNLKLPKFSGYDSQLDIFSFKREFGKLVEPYISKLHWSDTLKWKYLAGPALTLVESMTDIDKIWKKLESTYGDVQLLLQNKLISMGKIENLWEIKNDEKRISAISSLLNSMTELSDLAKEHELENELYYGGGVERVLSIMGTERKRKFVKKSETRLKGPEAWAKLRELLEKEQAECEKLALFEKTEKMFTPKETKDPKGPRKPPNQNCDGDPSKGSHNSFGAPLCCHICDEVANHVVTERGNAKFIQYFACKVFVEKKCDQRLKILNDKKLCPKCLRPGIQKGHKGVCYKQYLCPDPSHTNQNKVHVLVCGDHCTSTDNQALVEKYKTEVMEKLTPNMEQFSKMIKICNYNVHGQQSSLAANGVVARSNKDGPAVFKLQTLSIGGYLFKILYDDGCGDLVIKERAMEILRKLGRARQLVKGPLTLYGVSGMGVESKAGVWEIDLPLRTPTEEGETDACMSGLCLKKVTKEFPKIFLKTAGDELRDKWVSSGNQGTLPKLPEFVGGETDIIIGSQYLKFHPKVVFEMDSGLTLLESKILGSDGSTGVMGGPHPSFDVRISNPNPTHFGLGVYLTDATAVYRAKWMAGTDVSLLGNKALESQMVDEGDECFIAKRAPRNMKIHEQVESAGTEVTYRCVDCRGCSNCKTSGRIESISLNEEKEQALIEKSVTVHPDEGYTEAKLPFTADPAVRLKSNEEMAKKGYWSQVRRLSKSESEKQSVIESEGKLQVLEFVDWFDNLEEDEKELILSSNPKHFLNWTIAYNANSLSTPYRLVFDASRPVPGGCSLNEILPKGVNNMNKLIVILLRWSIRKCGFHCDIQKMYNSIRLDKRHWCYQLYLWHPNLDPNEEPRWKVIKTLIYGVISSGNQATCGLRKTARLMEDLYKRACEIVHEDTYVDDTISGEKDLATCNKSTRDLKALLKTGGFELKGFTISGAHPPSHLSEDGVSVNTSGFRWFSYDDVLRLGHGVLNFSKRTRGKKDQYADGVIPENLTRSHCQGKASEVFDPIGLAVPVTCGFKVDLKRLNSIAWEQLIPDEEKNLWNDNFSLIQDLRDVVFRRTVVPEDAMNLDIETIDVADASTSLMCAAIYARFKLRSGGYSCQLVFARSKLVPEDLSMPRAELSAAVLNASMGHVVKISFGEYHKGHIKLTDSQVALHWISTVKTELLLWVRNRVIEINRLAPMSCWRYVRSKDNIADMGTRKGARIEDISLGSEWFVGKPWMSLPADEFPLLTVQETVLSPTELLEFNKERMCPKVEFQAHWAAMSKPSNTTELGKRYEFSDYIIDPNRFRLRKVLRILALVIMFIERVSKARTERVTSLLKARKPVQDVAFFTCEGDQYLVTKGTDSQFPSKSGQVINLTDDYIRAALRYFFLKGTAEVLNFVNKKKYADVTTEIDGILYYNSRILPSESFGDPPSFSDAVLDLCSSSFVVPVLDFKSPIAYALMLETHRYHPDAQHAGLETVLRYSQTVAHILNGRFLAKEVGKYCIRCRIRNKARMKALMGPLGEENLKIAPAFYSSQVDIFGPYSSYSNVNKRATIKVWFVVYCCCVTGAVDVKIMEDYSTESFLLAFIRFSCQYGYPKTLLIDEGSQLVKGCKDMVISFIDLSHKLNFEYGVDFQPCPVGAHYMNGKAERKIQQVQKSMEMMSNERLSVIQWETLMASISNSVNNLPLGLGNKVESIENLDIITPNRLLLGRNNERSPTASLTVVDDYSKMLYSNARIFKAWFKAWLVSYVPEIIKMTKWFKSDEQLQIGDVVLFLKSDKVFETQYQYGLVKHVYASRDGIVRKAEIEYQNHQENVKRTTVRGVRELVVLQRFEEASIDEVLYKAWSDHSSDSSAAHQCECFYNSFMDC